MDGATVPLVIIDWVGERPTTVSSVAPQSHGWRCEMQRSAARLPPLLCPPRPLLRCWCQRTGQPREAVHGGVS